MRKINQNIDEIFKDGLSGYKETPPSYVWDSINDQMSSARNNKKTLYIWRNIAAAAVAIIVILTGVIVFQQNHNSTKNFISQSHQPSIAPTTKIESLASVDQNNLTTNSTKNPNIIDNKDNQTHIKTSNSNKDSQNVITKKTNTNSCLPNQVITSHVMFKPDDKQETKLLQTHENDSIRAESQIKEEDSATNKVDSIQNTPQEITKTTQNSYYAFNNQPHFEETTKRKLKYTLSGQFATGYSDKSLSNNGSSALEEEGINTISGGININVKTRKKWSFEAGVYYSQAGQKFANNLYNNSSIYSMSISSINSSADKKSLNNSLGNIKLNSDQVAESSISNIAAPIKAITSRSEVIGDINIQQQLEFIEVPFMIRYHIIDQAYNVSLGGGMSTNLLVGNNVYYIDGNNKELIGETENLNDFNYSAILSLGFEAPLWNSISINLEPRFKYFINSLSSENGNDYKPYSIGIFTGISYKF